MPTGLYGFLAVCPWAAQDGPSLCTGVRRRTRSRPCAGKQRCTRWRPPGGALRARTAKRRGLVVPLFSDVAAPKNVGQNKTGRSHCERPVKNLVAGTGFEPVTFGL